MNTSMKLALHRGRYEWTANMTKLKYLLTLIVVGCSSVGVVKIGDNLYQISEKSQPTQAEAEHIPDPAPNEIMKTSAEFCSRTNQIVKVISYERPIDPTIKQAMFKMTFRCVDYQ